MKRVIIESPYKGDVARNTEYARDCLRDSLSRGEAPFASHLLYTQVLNDKDPSERAQGMAAGLAWAEHADLVAVYCDLGLTVGMQLGLDAHIRAGRRVEIRHLGGKWRFG